MRKRLYRTKFDSLYKPLRRFSLMLPIIFGVMGCLSSSPCCPSIEYFSANPPSICSTPGEELVTLTFRVEFSRSGELCSVDPRPIFSLTFLDGSPVGGEGSLQWEDEGAVLVGTRIGVQINRGHNEIRLTIPGDGGCPYYDEENELVGASSIIEIPIMECSGPGDDVVPGGG